MFEHQKTLFSEIALELCQKIVCLELKPGDKLPTVRELAKEKKVNPNTIQKAYSLLESEGIVTSVPRSGKYVTNDASNLNDLSKNILKDEANKFKTNMNKYGFTIDEIVTCLEEMRDNEYN